MVAVIYSISSMYIQNVHGQYNPNESHGFIKKRKKESKKERN